MQIVLLNVSPDGNRGACALTWVSLDFVFHAFPGASVAIVPTAVTPPDPAPFHHTTLRYPNVEILPPLFDGEGKQTPALLHRLARSLAAIVHLSRRHPSRNRTLEWIRNSDLAVSVGGVVFQTRGGTLRDDARFLIRVLPLLAAQKIGIPSVLVGAHIGPFASRFGAGLFRRISRKAAAVFPRDHISAAELARSGTNAQSILMPDSAFALDTSRCSVGDLFERRGLDAAAATLALVISSALRKSERNQAHVDLLVHVARRLVESGRVSQLIVVIQSDEDQAISLDLLRGLQLDHRFLIDDDLDAGQLSTLYGTCRMVISSRLHAVILAMVAGVPAISLAPAVTFKESAVLEILGLESLCVPTTTDRDRAAELCLQIAAEEAQHRQAVVSAVSSARAKLQAVPELLRKLVAD